MKILWIIFLLLGGIQIIGGEEGEDEELQDVTKVYHQPDDNYVNEKIHRGFTTTPQQQTTMYPSENDDEAVEEQKNQMKQELKQPNQPPWPPVVNQFPSQMQPPVFPVNYPFPMNPFSVNNPFSRQSLPRIPSYFPPSLAPTYPNDPRFVPCEENDDEADGQENSWQNQYQQYPLNYQLPVLNPVILPPMGYPFQLPPPSNYYPYNLGVNEDFDDQYHQPELYPQIYPQTMNIGINYRQRGQRSLGFGRPLPRTPRPSRYAPRYY